MLFVFGMGNIANATNDDPGAPRLSGDEIPQDFYDNDSSNINIQNRSFLPQYGSSTSKSEYTGKEYKHADVFDNRGIVNGIDVSQWQENIDWEKVKDAGIEYALIRVGYRGYSAGSLTYPYTDANGTYHSGTMDTYYHQNMKNATAAGIKVGVYIFSQAITEDEAQEEAEYILNNIGDYPISMPLVFDFEYVSGGRLTSKLPKDKATAICMRFCDTIAAAGYTPMVYASKSVFENQMNVSELTDKGYRIWLAHYVNYDGNGKETKSGNGTSYAGTYDFWQYSSSGKVAGISGNVDMDFYYAQDGDNFIPNAVSIASTQISAIPNQTYTGSAIKPTVSVRYQEQPLILNEDYTVTYSSNTQVGKATVKISGKGIYKGSKTINFNIIPKTVTNLKAKKKKTNYITLRWDANTSGTCYQIYRATAQNGTYKKIKTIKASATTTYKDMNLTPGQCYYYKIRSYKTVNGTTYYSAFSPVKAIYTKTGYTRNALTKKNAIVYNCPSKTGTIIATPAAGKKLSVLYYTEDENGSGWYYVTYQSKNLSYGGFVQKKRVTITKVGKVLCSDYVNLRKSYSTNSKILTTVKKNATVTVLSSKKKHGNTWYKITYKKGKKTYTGYILSTFVKIQ